MREILDMEEKAGEAKALLESPVFQEMCDRLEARAIEMAIANLTSPGVYLMTIQVIRNLKAELESTVHDPSLARLAQKRRQMRT